MYPKGKVVGEEYHTTTPSSPPPLPSVAKASSSCTNADSSTWQRLRSAVGGTMRYTTGPSGLQKMPCLLLSCLAT